jgi:hypothetical protein
MRTAQSCPQRKLAPYETSVDWHRSGLRGGKGLTVRSRPLDVGEAGEAAVIEGVRGTW